MLNRRQINVQRANLANMCRISVKSLLDYACLYSHVDDDCEEFINFCAVFEQVVSHRLRPYPRKVWLPRGVGSPRHFWEVVVEQHHSNPGFLYQTCIPNIEAIETLKSPKAKLRAFLRVALMEKRLSDYMNWILNNARLMRESYMEGALLASEEASVLCGDLIGLNAIDFNFCLKGNESELLGPLEISYGPFLKYKQSSASHYSDEIEMLQLSGKEEEEDMGHQPLTEGSINDLLRLQSLEKDFRAIKEQKDYLEELVRLRERQVLDLTQKCERILQEHGHRERDWEVEKITLDSCMIELQAQMANLCNQNEMLRSQVAWLRQFKERSEMAEVPMIEIAGGGMDRLPPPEYTKGPHQSDQRSISSSQSDQGRSLQEDAQSMVPLTGSLAEVTSAMLDQVSKSPAIPPAIMESNPPSDGTTRNPEQLSPQPKRQTGEEIQRSEETVGVPRVATLVSREVTQATLDSTQLSEEAKQTPEKTMSWGLDESYVITGEKSGQKAAGEEEGFGADTNVQSEDPVGLTVTVDSPLESTPQPSPLSTSDPSHVMVASDGALSSEPESADNLTSDPELLEHGNTSSDSSDAAWDMLSDSEHVEHKAAVAEKDIAQN